MVVNKKSKSSKNLRLIKDKQKRSERVSTGIEYLDKLIEGGFEKNSTNLVIGDTGSGKTIFGVQFLLEGIKKKEKGLFITFEETKKEFYENMKNLGFDLEKLKEDFYFLEYSPEKVKTMIEEGGGAIETLIIDKKIKRVVIDSMNSFGLLFQNDLEKKEALISLFRMLKKWDCTVLLIYGKSEESKGDYDIIELESDSIIDLHYVREGKERKRYMEIIKMRGTKHPFKMYYFVVEKGGIKIIKEKD